MPAALLAALVLQATPETLADLQRAYEQTCLSRIYGQFDDMCASMEAQVKHYRAELRRHPVPPSASPPGASAPVQSSPAAEPASSEPQPPRPPGV